MAEESDKKLITPLIFNDEPIGRGETAYFQFERYADTFARIIAAKDTRTPLTIGVHGEWGSATRRASNSHFARLGLPNPSPTSGFGNPEGAIPAKTDYSTAIMRIVGAAHGA
jgi:hypothetical protein